MTKPIIAVPTGTNVLYLGARNNCAADYPQTGSLAVWRADCGPCGRTTITYQSMGTDLDGRLKFVLDDALLMTEQTCPPRTTPTVGRFDGILTTHNGCAPVRLQLGGTYTVASTSASPGYANCEPHNCLDC